MRLSDVAQVVRGPNAELGVDEHDASADHHRQHPAPARCEHHRGDRGSIKAMLPQWTADLPPSVSLAVTATRTRTIRA
ncbi:MAG: hypothetical protein U1E17_13425 [Geminicoccaceae bacterium]